MTRPDKTMNDKIIEEFRANGGKVGGYFEKATLLVLHTTGAKSGKERVNPVGAFRYNDMLLIAGSNNGADVDPPWAHNLRAHPRAHIEIGTDAYDVEARELPRDERDPAYAHIEETTGGFGGYQAMTDRIIPLFELRKL